MLLTIHQNNASGAPLPSVCNLAFASWFMLEHILFACASGRFWFSNPLNCLDFILVGATFIASVMLQTHELGLPQVALVYGLMAMRIFQAITRVRRFQIILRAFVLLMPAAGSLVGVVLMVFYAYAALGMTIFDGGFPVERTAKIPGYNTSDFHLASYEVNNFDNIFNSFVTLFELLVVNNWQVTMHGYRLVWGDAFAIPFFVSFWCVCVFIASNLLVAFVLEAFEVEKTLRKSDYCPIGRELTRVREKHNETFRIKRRRRLGDVQRHIFQDEIQSLIQDIQSGSEVSAPGRIVRHKSFNAFERPLLWEQDPRISLNPLETAVEGPTMFTYGEDLEEDSGSDEGHTHVHVGVI
eukprot:NODE_2675_length_1144_cov_26.606393_g2453_i0.p1 GENE.NODE_2675_length_1144_cov_26.606393_g2453_i0~~NODE_2675_length_1144_cov_26.606393_g2453_i0.p1  ORF type:complete len:379 (-),score=57.41 NODE_2675_length_1144_cov_26.606393_g2453_i0:7-1065(-)